MEQEGEDSKEFHSKLERMGWNLDSIRRKPNGNENFLEALLLELRSGNPRRVATLIGADLSSVK